MGGAQGRVLSWNSSPGLSQEAVCSLHSRQSFQDPGMSILGLEMVVFLRKYCGKQCLCQCFSVLLFCVLPW